MSVFFASGVDEDFQLMMAMMMMMMTMMVMMMSVMMVMILLALNVQQFLMKPLWIFHKKGILFDSGSISITFLLIY